MQRPEEIIAKVVPLYERSILTSHEFIDLFVHRVIESHREHDSASLLTLLPPDLAAGVLPFVRKLIEQGYDSYPGAVGRARTDDEIAEFTVGLREMDRLLSTSREAPTS